jgi:predicted ester cyclase
LPGFPAIRGVSGDVGLVKEQGNCVLKADLSDIYRDYIAFLNTQEWCKLEQLVHDEAYYSGRRVGLSSYREMLERVFMKFRPFISTFIC